jgi:Domain of unknown function (DUF4189)
MSQMSTVLPRRATVAQIVVAVAIGCYTLLWAPPSVADGALAVGVPANVARQGFSYAYSNDKKTAEEARAKALQLCRSSKEAPAIARRLCHLVRTYHNECVAVAMDPVTGTPGVGWAIAATLHDAEAQALAACEKTAGPGRRAACRIDHSKCDGTAK